MILDRLTLDGFRLHRRTEIAFGEGLTAIVGANGAGKSTLLEAVAFALFGEQRGTKETLRGDDGAPYRVRLEFRLGDVPYVVERRPDRAFLAQGDRRLAEGLADTTRACVRLLGLGYEQFRNSFLAEQKGLAFLRFRTAAARQEEVARMLGLDRLRRAEGLAAEARRTAAAEVRALGETVGDETAIRAAAREADEAVKAARTEVRVTTIEAKRAGDEAARAEPGGQAAETYLAFVAREATAREALRFANSVRNVADDALAQARLEEAELLALAETVRRHAELTALLPAATAAARAGAEAERLDPGGTSSVEEIAALLQSVRAEWNARRELAVAESAAAREALLATREALLEAESGEEGAPCPVCGRPLGPEARTWRLELAARVAAAESRLERAGATRVAAAPPEAAGVERRLRAAELRREATVDRRPEEIEAEIARWAPAAARAKALAGSDRRLRDAETRAASAGQDEKRATDEARVTAEALRATGVADAEAARGALARAAAARAAAGSSETALRAAEAGLRTAERAQAAAEARLREARERREALRAARHAESLNGAVASELRALRTALNGALRPDLEARAGELLERMTAGRYRRVRLSADFEPTVVDEETDRPILSGGEEDVVALALRLALAELVQDRQGHALTLLMMDEAFGALDAERRQSLLDVLTGLKERYAQVIVVSHVDEVAQVADRVLRVTRDATGAARVAED